MLCLFGSGCVAMGKYNGGKYYPFKASSYDIVCIGASVYYPIAGWPDDGPTHVFDFLISPPFIPFWLVDLVFSFVSDLITFPYDLYHVGQEIDGSTEDDEKSEDEPETKPAPGSQEKKPDEPREPK